jgi:hypothetical protein
MKKRILITVIVFIGLNGCAPIHYTRNGSDFVTLYLRLPDAKIVQFASSVDNYQVHDILKSEPGFWEVSIPRQLEFKYFYIVDGVTCIPDCRFKEQDDFGKQNCIYLP